MLKDQKNDPLSIRSRTHFRCAFSHETSSWNTNTGSIPFKCGIQIKHLYVCVHQGDIYKGGSGLINKENKICNDI